MKLESKIQTDIIKYLKLRPNSFVFKCEPTPTGIPDISALLNGVQFYFEVKRSKKHKPTKIQKYRHKQLRKAGANVYVVWKLSQVIKIMLQLSCTKG